MSENNRRTVHQLYVVSKQTPRHRGGYNQLYKNCVSGVTTDQLRKVICTPCQRTFNIHRKRQANEN